MIMHEQTKVEETVAAEVAPEVVTETSPAEMPDNGGVVGGEVAPVEPTELAAPTE